MRQVLNLDEEDEDDGEVSTFIPSSHLSRPPQAKATQQGAPQGGGASIAAPGHGILEME